MAGSRRQQTGERQNHRAGQRKEIDGRAGLGGNARARTGETNAALARWASQVGRGAGEVGYWANPSAPSLVETTAGKIRMDKDGLLANLNDADKVAPFQPWRRVCTNIASARC